MGGSKGWKWRDSCVGGGRREVQVGAWAAELCGVFFTSRVRSRTGKGKVFLEKKNFFNLYPIPLPPP